MKIVKLIIIILCIILVIGLIIWKNIVRNEEEKIEDNNKTIVTSFYPMYIIAKNIVQNTEGINLMNMADANVGCLHDYTLTTEDMKKIENADVFIENGLGMESFISKIIESNSNIDIIDSSTGIENIISEGQETNAHIWTSIENYILQVNNISNGLKKIDAANANIYEQNTNNYLEKLEKLKKDMEIELKDLKGIKVVCLNEAFSYMGQELGMDMLTVETNHEESSMSAEKLKGIIDTMQTENIDIIIIDKNDNRVNAEALANETGASICQLDSGLSGSMEQDAYINLMKQNIEELKELI